MTWSWILTDLFSKPKQAYVRLQLVIKTMRYIFAHKPITRNRVYTFIQQ